MLTDPANVAPCQLFPGEPSLLQALVEAHAGCVALVDPHHRVLAVNSAWRDYVGNHCQRSCERCEHWLVGGDYLLDCVALHGPVTSQSEVRAGIESILDGRRLEFVTQYRVSGDYWMQIQVKALAHGHGYLVVLHDVSAQRNAALDLDQSEQRYRSLFESSQDAVYVVDSTDILMVNPSGLRLLGLESESELLGRNPLSLVHPDFHEVARQRFRNTLNDGRVNPPVEIKLLGRDGHLIDVESISSPCHIRGRRAIHIVMRDITARRATEDALRRQSEFNEKLIATTQCIILVLDVEGRIVRINPYLESICGYTNEEVVGRDWFDTFLPSADAAAIRTLFRGAINDIETRGNVSPLVDRSGSVHMIEWYDKTIKDGEGRTLGLLATGQVITQRLELERRQRETTQRLVDLSRHMVGIQEHTRRRLAAELHDRTSPNLAAIGINLEIARLALNSRDWEEVALRMSDNGALIQDTAASIRDICTELRPPALDYGGVQPALETYASQFFRRTGIPVTLEGDCQSSVIAPEIQSNIFRIFQEALTNIAKHADAHAVSVHLDADTEILKLTIEDDGRGFDPMALKRSVAVDGLGLINMREMAEFSGGVFDLESQPGAGTRLAIAIPLQVTTS